MRKSTQAKHLVEFVKKNKSDISFKLSDDKKFKNIGNGGYAIVYMHRDFKDVVIKIAFYDEAYDDYAKHAMKHYKKYKHLPRIYARIKLDGCSYVYVLERLKRVRSNPVVDMVYDTMSRYYFNEHWHENISKKRANKCLIETIKKLPKKLRMFMPDLHMGNIMQRANGTIVLTDPFC